MSADSPPCHVGLIGLGVMGRNLVLNIADHGYNVAVYNRTGSITTEFLSQHTSDVFPDAGGLKGCESLEDFVRAIRAPRVIIVLVKAGAAVDAVCEQLISAGAGPQDIVVDGGNSLWTDTIRRDREGRARAGSCRSTGCCRRRRRCPGALHRRR